MRKGVAVSRLFFCLDVRKGCHIISEQSKMKITIKNLGALKQAEFTLGEMTYFMWRQ